MKVLKRKSGLLLEKGIVDDEEIADIKQFLTRKSFDYQNKQLIESVFYLETDSHLLIPRYFPVEKFVKDFVIENEMEDGVDIELNHNIIPRNEIQKRSIKRLLENDSGILQLVPGMGKTIISIFMVAERKKKTFVLVHKRDLVEQWKERFLSFTDLKDDQVSLLKSKSFKDDLKKPIIICTDQTFMSLLKRKRKEFLLSLRDSNIGIFIGDEVHTSVGAPTFSECSIHIPCKYTYGLSATPYRYDKNEDIIKFHMGEILKEEGIQDTLNAEVFTILLDYEIDREKSYKYLYWGGKFQRARYLNLIKKSNNFNGVVKAILNKLKNLDRNFIIVGERKKLLDKLFLEYTHDDKGIFYESVTRDVLEKKAIFATPGKIRDGIDAPWKDTIVTTSPISNIEQLAGRITRTNKNKKTPYIFDMVDISCRNISSTFYNRHRFYSKKEWKVKFFIAHEKIIKEVEKEKAFEILRSGEIIS